MSSPDILDLRRLIPEEDFWFSFSRSSGPGGQNVNKVSTRTTLFFDLDGCQALTDSQKGRIATRLETRISKEGILRVVAARHRTQLANKRAAVNRFYELLEEALRRSPKRKPTAVPPGSRRKRLKNKLAKGQQKQLRASVRRSHDE